MTNNRLKLKIEETELRIKKLQLELQDMKAALEPEPEMTEAERYAKSVDLEKIGKHIDLDNDTIELKFSNFYEAIENDRIRAHEAGQKYGAEQERKKIRKLNDAIQRMKNSVGTGELGIAMAYLFQEHSNLED